jgi:sugar phosphate isomerase/epimerase
VTDLVLATQTVGPGTTFLERVVAARDTGCIGIGLRPKDFEAELAAGSTAADLRAILGDHGVALTELEVLRQWAAGGEGEQRSRASEDEFWQLADALGGRHLMAITDRIAGTLDDAAEKFAGLCDRAAAHGLLVVLEFLPWTEMSDAGIAGEIARRAGRPNGGVLVDTWHHFRGANDPDLIRQLGPELIMAVQFDDATAEPVGDVFEDTTQRRLVPGEGDFDLAGFVALVDEIGVDAPWSVEVLSTELHRHPPTEAARRAIDATRAILAAAREGATGRGRDPAG